MPSTNRISAETYAIVMANGYPNRLGSPDGGATSESCDFSLTREYKGGPATFRDEHVATIITIIATAEQSWAIGRYVLWRSVNQKRAPSGAIPSSGSQKSQGAPGHRKFHGQEERFILEAGRDKAIYRRMYRSP